MFAQGLLDTVVLIVEYHALSGETTPLSGDPTYVSGDIATPRARSAVASRPFPRLGLTNRSRSSPQGNRGGEIADHVGCSDTAGGLALIVGAMLSTFTERPWYWSALRSLSVGSVAGAITYAIGSALVAAG